MKLDKKRKSILFSMMAILLMQFILANNLLNVYAASACGGCGFAGGPASGGAIGVSPGVSAGISFNSIEVEFCDLNQQKDLLVNRVDRVESLLTNVLSEDPIIWVIM